MAIVIAVISLFLVSCSENNEAILTDWNHQHLENPADDAELVTEVPVADKDGSGAPINQVTCIKGLSINTYLVQALEDGSFNTQACAKASKTQIKEVEKGNAKYDKFISQCYAATGNSCWCDQLVRPNPASINTFYCTYPEEMLHQLIHPNESTWKYAFNAVKIIQDLQDMNISVSIIYNWWRPEPYNKNVGGSPTRHPHGTSVDVRFATKNDQETAHAELCKMRKKGRLRALGYYSSTALHFGVGDSRANTWGKGCP